MLISPYFASPNLVIHRLLTLAKMKKGETLYDLGSGDGRTLVIAATEFGAKGVGIELREDLIRKAVATILRYGLQDSLKIIKKDMFQVDISAADAVYLYLTTSANEKVRPKLESELRKGTRVVSHDYEITKWKAIKVEKFCEDPEKCYPIHTLYLYKR